MGRKSYEKVLSFGTWPYAEIRVIVLSRHPIKFPDTIPDSVTCSSESPRALYERLESEGAQHLYIDGGNTIQRFLSDGLIDELTITMIPVLLGSGIPLFGTVEQDISLTPFPARTYAFGFVQIKYTVHKPQPS